MHFAVGDIVQRVDIKGRKRFVIVRIATDGSGWSDDFTISATDLPRVKFPSQFMLKKVGPA